MKQIDKNELYQNLRGFLKSKGISLDEGTYTQRIHRGCNLLADAINTTSKTVARAKVKVNKTVDHLRQSIHEATAPRPPTTGRPGGPESRPKPGKAPAARAKRPPGKRAQK